MALRVSINKVIFPNSSYAVSFDLQAENGVVNIAGENGIGKTSILKSVVGIHKFQGHAIFNDKDIRDFNALEKSSIVFCPDKYLFSEAITAKEYLDFIALSYNILPDTQPYRDSIKELGIPNKKLTEEIRTLSYGTVKKLLLAATFLPTAKLIVMDEPINGLDAKGKDWLASQIQYRLNDHLFLMTCHDKSWLKQFSPQEAWVQENK